MVSANQCCVSGAALICSRQSFCSQLFASSNSKVGTALFSEEKGRIAGLPPNRLPNSLTLFSHSQTLIASHYKCWDTSVTNLQARSQLPFLPLHCTAPFQTQKSVLTEERLYPKVRTFHTFLARQRLDLLSINYLNEQKQYSLQKGIYDFVTE